jgi:two-component system OmpR family response regulator
MKILNYSFFESEKFDMKKVDDNEVFFNEVISKKYDVILVDFTFYSDIKEIKNFFNGYIIFLSYFCDNLYYKKVLEIGDFCYLYSEYEKIVLRLNYLNKKILKRNIIKFNGFTYNFKTKNLYYKNELILLTKAESEILYFLLKNKEKFVSKIEILENSDFIENIDSIKVIISNFRKKGIDIINKKNLGYKINLKEKK